MMSGGMVFHSPSFRYCHWSERSSPTLKRVLNTSPLSQQDFQGTPRRWRAAGFISCLLNHSWCCIDGSCASAPNESRRIPNVSTRPNAFMAASIVDCHWFQHPRITRTFRQLIRPHPRENGIAILDRGSSFRKTVVFLSKWNLLVLAMSRRQPLKTDDVRKAVPPQHAWQRRSKSISRSSHCTHRRQSNSAGRRSIGTTAAGRFVPTGPAPAGAAAAVLVALFFSELARALRPAHCGQG